MVPFSTERGPFSVECFSWRYRIMVAAGPIVLRGGEGRDRSPS